MPADHDHLPTAQELLAQQLLDSVEDDEEMWVGPIPVSPHPEHRVESEERAETQT